MISFPTLHAGLFAIENIPLVFAKADGQDCQGGEGTVGVSSGVRAKDSWREGKPTLDSGYYPIYPISSFYGADSGGCC